MALACKYCIMTRGLKGSDIKNLPQTDEEFFQHIEREHHIAVKREGETKAQCMKRFYKENPEALDRATCKCPECAHERGEI